MSEAVVSYALANGVATLTLNRPEGKNALSGGVLNGLGDGLKRAAEDPAVRAVVLTNVGNTFCAGADLKGGDGETPRYGLVEVFELLLDSPKPVIGRIDGHCMGGGVGLAAACDISVVRDDAKLGFTEVRLGVAPAIISVVCLPKMRRGDAMELFLTGERITAQRAAAVGLINYAVPEAELDQRVEAIVGQIVQGGPKALKAAKDLVLNVPGMARKEALAWTGPMSAELFASDEARLGIAAFRSRVPAPWVPRVPGEDQA